MTTATDPHIGRSTLVLTARDVAALLDLDTCISAVEQAFRACGLQQAPRPHVLGVHTEDGGFHIKAGLLEVDGRGYFAAKTNSNFRQNPERHQLPTIQGVVVLCDASDGRLLALIDSRELTALRTGAATAVAARHLARRDASTAIIIGCGKQGRVQLRALARVCTLRGAFVYDRDPAAAADLARTLAPELGFMIEPVDDPARGAGRSDICITCTPSRVPVLHRDDVRPGTFVAGVGADSEDKWELAPELLAGATLVVDVLEQAATIGDLHHAIAAGVLTRESVHAELGAIVAGLERGRATESEITVFDSTGMALQDVAAAAAVYRRALSAETGLRVEL